ncbi:amino acid adenylation domain-containing protein, partial [Ascidiimonas sp. W6]|uniref:non-ribosomal peptide synthetase n=1 Tax=Ascidiimonas meishanensis TaxID=3128903 RepID=UPI0030EEA2BC
EHQHAPFEKIVERVVDTRDMSTSALFQVMFVLQNTPELSKDKGVVLDGDVEISEYQFPNTTAKYDLTLNAVEGDNGIAFNMEYCTDLFDKATIERMLSHYQNLLVSIVNNMTLPITQLAFLPEQEKHLLLDVFNDTEVANPKDKTIVDLFKEQVNATPYAIALVFEDTTMTYKELDDKSNQLCHYLESEGVVKDYRLGMLLNRNFDMIVSILGILKSGCAYVPLDPSLPSYRLEYILKDSGVNHIVYKEESLVSVLPVSEYTFLNIENSITCTSSEIVTQREQNSVAYVMYTSGTTGTPKGILINDNNIITLINDPLSKIAVNSTDRVLQWSNYAFDGSAYEIFGSLLCGASLYLIDSSIASNADALSQLIDKEQLNVVFITTALFNSLADYDLSRLSSLRILLFGGEKVSVSPVRKMLSVLGSGRLLHVYGPTETTVYATCYEINNIPDVAETIPIGGPLTNTSLYVLNSSQGLVPIGVAGELCISGSGVSKGYLNQEELTKQKFVTNPFVEREIMYRTGDLAKWLPDGSIEFVGRADDQVKIRGYRIELGEIESVLLEATGVQDCCVLAKEDTTSTKRLVGYVVVEDDFDKAKVQEALKLKLPDYMVPTIWVELQEMPLTTNGKLDKKALPDPDASLLSSQSYVAPRNLTEQTLVTIWQKLLGVEQIGVHDNFFELGGHSLLATRLVSMIRKELNIEIAIKEVFANPTIDALALLVSQQSQGTLLPAIRAEERPHRIPLSFSQERLWFLDQLEGSIAYHIPMVIRLQGKLNITALEKALKAIIERHEILRTLIGYENGIGYQKIISAEQWALEQLECSANESLDSLIASFLETPFDLAKKYKFRSALYHIEEGNYVLAMV